MRRGCGLVLLPLGVLLTVLGLILGIIAVAGGQPNGAPVAVFAAMLLLGVGLLYCAWVALRGAKPFGSTPKPVKGRVGNYLADAVEMRQANGLRYKVFYQTPVKGKRGRPSLLEVGLPVVTTAPLQFKPQTWFDRFCLTLGIARALPTGDQEFDQGVFVRGPSDANAEQYLHDEQKRTAIRALLLLGFREVRLTGTDAQAAWTGFDPTKNDRPELTEDAAEALHVVATGLPEVAVERDRFDGPAFRHIMLWVLLALFAASVVFLFIYPAVHEGPLIWTSLSAFAVIYPLFGFVAGLMLRGPSIAHDRWGRLMGWGVLLLGAGSAGLVAAANGLADESPRVVRNELVIDHHVSRGRHGTSYYATVRDWDRPANRLDFSVSSTEYGAIRPGRSRLELTTRRGRLGIEWLRSKRVIP